MKLTDHIIYDYLILCKYIEKYLPSLFSLVCRIILFEAFFYSGWLKVEYALNGQWDTVIQLFQNEYKAPLISAELAAILGTVNEFAFSILITIGLFSRISALGLLATSIMIQLIYQAHLSHIIWMLCSGYIFIHGSGAISIDNLIYRKFRDNAVLLLK